MSSDAVISLSGLGKCYQIYSSPRDRLLQMLVRNRKKYFREFWALRDVTLQIEKGQSLGVVGRNGAGKSTLLQLICGTLNSTTGRSSVIGRVAALLELGAGFNPEFTGRENVYLSATILGLTQEEIVGRYDEIVHFSGIGDFIDQPVKTYSSGMYVRLAFSVATSVNPEILVIDEALSVGDGEFARKSFDRIMELKKRGTTILFCSHSLYQIESFCTQALWLEHGSVRMLDTASRVASAYQAALDTDTNNLKTTDTVSVKQRSGGCLRKVTGTVDGASGILLRVISLQSTVSIFVEFQINPDFPAPSVALGIANEAGLTITSVSSANDKVSTVIDALGRGEATIVFPRLALLKGIYYITVFLACEKALHVYDVSERCLTLQVTQEGLAQGVVDLAHEWQI